MEPISNQQVHDILKQHFGDAQISVEGDGYQYRVTVVTDEFEGKNTVQRHKMIYGLLNEPIAEGRLHALSLKTLTPQEK